MKRTLSILALVMLVPLAAAHGAPEAREIDERVLVDGTTNGDYGASGTLDQGGLDVLALDVYEATHEGAPAVVFRVTVQGGDPAKTHTLSLSTDAGSLSLTSTDLVTYTSTDFAAVRGPFDVGDGHPKAIEGIATLAQLGLATGDSIGAIRVSSSMDGDAADVMPGSWFLNGVEVPTSEEADEGTYTLQGTPTWFTMASDVEAIEGPGALVIDLESQLADMEQFLTLTVESPAGMTATLDGATAILGPGEARNKTLTITGFGPGDVRVTAISDLGLEQTLVLPILAAVETGDGSNVESALLDNGGSFLYQFTSEGTFEYHCHPHPNMQGTITIEAADGEPQTHVVRMVEGDSNDVLSFAFSPAELTIGVNDTVVWINDGQMQHNVMGTTGVHDHGDHDHDEAADEGIPGPAVPLLGLTLLAVALYVSRR